MEALYHFPESPAPQVMAANRGSQPPARISPLAGNLSEQVGRQTVTAQQTSAVSGRRWGQAAASLSSKWLYTFRQVRMYCFRWGKCGTFMPLSCSRGEFRIAVVWTLLVAVVSANSPVHFRVLFTHAVGRLAVDCG